MSVSSVPLQKAAPSSDDLSALSQGGKKHHDSILMYCSYFTYGKNPQQQRNLFCKLIEVKNIINKLDQLKRKYISEKINLIPYRAITYLARNFASFVGIPHGQ